jgi:photosystem II stability/assembly factor-like uncharacterized protein
MLTLVLGRTVAAQGGGFFEPFDDPALPGWEIVGQSAVENGNLVMQAGGGVFRLDEWSDFELFANLRRSGEGELVIHARFSDSGNLSLRLGPGYAALLLNNQLLAEGPTEEIPPGEWFGLRVVAVGAELIAEINGLQVVSADVSSGPGRGPIGFFFEGPGEGAVDFAELISLGEVPPEPLPQPTEAAPEVEPPPNTLSEATRTTEAVLVMTENMENGIFDAANPSGPGTFKVEPAADGDLAAHLTGPVDIKMAGAAWQSYSWRDYDLSLRLMRSSAGTIGFGLRWIEFFPNAPEDTNRGYWVDHDGEEWILTRDDQGRITQLARFEGSVSADTWHDLVLSVQDVAEGTQFIVTVDSVEVFRFTDASPIPFGALAFRTHGAAVDVWLDDLQVTAHLDPTHTWRQARGPQGASGMNALSVDPRDWQVAYAGGQDAGLFKTTDGGGSWQEIGITREVWTPRIQTIVFAPSDPSIMYLGAGGKHISPIWRSDDGGEIWHWMQPTGPAGDWLAEADAMAVAVMPDDPMHIYFGIGSGIVPIPPEYSGVYESRDGGQTYHILNSGGGSIGPVVIDPADARHILAGSLSAVESGASVVATYDGGQTWASSDEGLAGKNITQLIFDPSTPGTVLALEFSLEPEVGGSVFRSLDGGRSWRSLESHPNSNGLLYNPLPTPTLFSNHPDGLYSSTDAGDSWTLVNDKDCIGGMTAMGTDDPEVIYSITPPSISISTDLGATCTKSTSGLLAHPVIGLGTSESNPAVVYIGTTSGVYKSTDAGETWDLLLSGPPSFAGIAVHPDDSETVYLGAVEFGEIHKSTDGGATWTNLDAAIDYPGVSTLAIDPNDPNTIYAGTGHGPQMPPQGAGLYKSSDAGNSWQRLSGVPDVAVTAIEIDRGGSGRVAVSTMGSGVLISEDNGLTFEARNSGFVDDPVGGQIWALEMHPQNPDILYAGTSIHYSRVGTGGFDGLYKTTDGGLSWTMILGGEQVTVPPNGHISIGGGIDALAINPARPDEVYAALHDPGIVLSADGGQTWDYVNSGLVPLMTHVYPYRMDISPTGDVLYATSCGRSIFRNLTNVPEDSLTSFLGMLPAEVPGAAEPPPEPGEAEPEAQPTPTTEPGGFQLPCIGGALPLLALALLRRKR